MKRNSKVAFCLNEEERRILDGHVNDYASHGINASLSFVIRYAIKRLPAVPAP